MGEVITYKFGRKNNWRNECWNYIRDNIKDRDNAKVLYLSGREDLDRVVAIRKGFKERNLFAVSNDKEIASDLRSKKRNVIHGDIIDAAFAFNEKLDVIHLDLCTGLDQDAKRIAFAFFCCLKVGGVLLVNMQRGRESYSNAFRANVQDQLDKAFTNVPGHLKQRFNAKHRGIHLYYYVMAWRYLLEKSYAIQMPIESILRGSVVYDSERFVNDFYNRVPRKVLSYKSSVVMMDSIIIKNTCYDDAIDGGFIPKKPKHGAGSSCVIDETGKLVRQIAAVKANSTRRCNKKR